jgi:hypothetical protein
VPSLLSLSCWARLNCQPSTNWAPGWRPFHTNLLIFSSQDDFQLTTELVNLIVLKISPRRGTHQKHCSSLVANAFFSSGTCLPGLYLEMDCITPLLYCCGRYLATAAVYRVVA